MGLGGPPPGIKNNSLEIYTQKIMHSNLNLCLYIRQSKARILKNNIFNKPTSRWLNIVNKTTSDIQYRSIVTDVKHRQPESVNPFPSNWNKIKWKEIGTAVYNKQVKLVKLAGKNGLHDRRVRNLQNKLCLSLEFRLWAVYKITKNKGSSTPGIDGKILETGEEKLIMVKELKETFIDADKGKFKKIPVKWVMIPKSNGKLRRISIPTIKDRCLQQLVTLVLEPLIEMNSDTQSYGFRKYRSAKNAIASVRTILQSGLESKWVLDADIKSFFDEISHEWLLNNVPLSKTLKYILKSWLTSGAILKEGNEIKEIDTELGTPQGAIISPILGNFVLNGLEKAVRYSIKSITGGNEFRKNIYKDGVRIKLLSFKVKTVRYADDFVIIATSRRILDKFIKPAVTDFLKERGLRLSTEKTKMFCLASGEELNFLGYTFKYRKNWSLKYSFFKEKLGRSGIALYPNKRGVKTIIKRLKDTIMKNYNLTAYELISLLNPIIRGWARYFNMGESSYYRGIIRYALYLQCWRWAYKKHPRWGKNRIADTYFLEGKKLIRKKGSNKWTFTGMTRNTSRYSDTKKGKTRELLDFHSVVNTVAGRTYNIPNRLLDIHAYHPNIPELIEFQLNANFASLGKHEGIKGKLLIKQEGLCALCQKSLFHYPDGSNIEGTYYEIDHIIPISVGGSKTSIKNLRLIHKWCHNVVTFSRQQEK